MCRLLFSLYKSFSTFHFCKVPVIAVQNCIHWRFSWQNILTLETDSWSTRTLSYTILIWFLWTGVLFKAVVIVWMVWVLHNFHCILMKDCFYLLTLKLDDIAHIYIVYSVQEHTNYVGDAFRIYLCMKQI